MITMMTLEMERANELILMLEVQALLGMCFTV